MPWRTPNGPLVHEHVVILRLVAVMRAQLDVMRESRRADPTLIAAATDFIRTYADRCHHGKEESILFRELAKKDLPPDLARAMRDLVDEHVHARTLTGALVEANAAYAAGDTSALAAIEATMRELVELYPRHIEKEDRHFFPESLAYLSAEEQASMLAEYDEFDRTLIHAKYLAVVEELEARAG